MKRVVIGMLIMAVAGMAQAELVSNGDFNTGDTSGWWTYIPDTDLDPGNQGLSVQDVVNYDGTDNLEFWAGTDESWMEVGQDFAVDAETTYTLSLVYNKVSWAGMGVNIKFLDSGWGWLSEQWLDVSGSGVEGDGAWYNFTQGITTPVNTAHMEVKLVAGGWGTVYVDNVSVVPEPTTMALLALGGVGLLRRRK